LLFSLGEFFLVLGCFLIGKEPDAERDERFPVILLPSRTFRKPASGFSWQSPPQIHTEASAPAFLPLTGFLAQDTREPSPVSGVLAGRTQSIDPWFMSSRPSMKIPSSFVRYA
jgi:hypothetical protein